MSTDTDGLRRAAPPTATGGPLPPVRPRTAPGPSGADAEPVPAALLRQGPATGIGRLDARGSAWVVTRHAPVRAVTGASRSGPGPAPDGLVARLAPRVVVPREPVLPGATAGPGEGTRHDDD